MNSGWNEGERKLTIGLDYDDTYTADPELWNKFIGLAKARGHKVVCVSCRKESEENRTEMNVPCALYLTDMAPKKWHMEQNGIDVDVWIDDCPEGVLNGR